MVCRWSNSAWRLFAALTLVVSGAGCAVDALRGQVELPSQGTAGPTQILRLGSLGVVWERLGQLPPVYQIPETKYLNGEDALHPAGDIPVALFVIRATLVIAELLVKLPTRNESCTDPDKWQEQLRYGKQLVEHADDDAARAVLIPALAACDPRTRSAAFEALVQLSSGEHCSYNPDWPKKLAKALKLQDQNDITGSRDRS